MAEATVQTSPTTTVNAGRMFGIRRASAEASFPPILSVVSVNVEKRIAMKTQARVDSWRRRNTIVNSLPRLNRGSQCLVCNGGTNGFVQHARHRRASGEAIRISMAACPNNHSKSIICDLIDRFRHVLVNAGDDPLTSADVLWVNQCSANALRTFAPHQRMNFFPFLNRMMTKANIAKQLNLHRTLFPSEYDFYPETLELPRDMRALQRIMKQENESGTWILKPTKGLQGIGIVLARTFAQVEQTLQSNDDKVYSVQRYIDRPMLLNDAKWDMRIYVMLESLRPFRAHLFKDGLARFATERYAAPRPDNLGQSMVHLTNYSLNKKSSRFRMFKQGAVSEEECHKRTISTTLRQLQEAGHPVDVEHFWEEVGAIVGKTLVAMWPQLQDSHATYFKKVGSTVGASYDQACFHVLGFDIMMDARHKLWLLEVNSNPSLNRDSVIDAVINEQVMESCLRIVRILDPRQQYVDKSPETSEQGNGTLASSEVSTDDDTSDDEASVSGTSHASRVGEAPSGSSGYLARLPHVKPMTHMTLYLDLSYAHLMVFNRHLGEGAAGEGNNNNNNNGADSVSAGRTLWRVYATHLWEPKRSSRASARLLHALAPFQPPTAAFGAADAHIIYAQLQSYSTNRTYPWRQAFEFVSDCPAMTFSMFCEAVAIVARRWYPADTPVDSLHAFLNAAASSGTRHPPTVQAPEQTAEP
ncbi:ATP-grasp domain-containing protein [Plasmodiophora brassicae]